MPPAGTDRAPACTAGLAPHRVVFVFRTFVNDSMAEIDAIATKEGPAAGLAAALALIGRIKDEYLELENVLKEDDKTISKLEGDLAEVRPSLELLLGAGPTSHCSRFARHSSRSSPLLTPLSTIRDATFLKHKSVAGCSSRWL